MVQSGFQARWCAWTNGIAALWIDARGSFVATVLAGLYPASIAQRLNPIEVIHEE